MNQAIPQPPAMTDKRRQILDAALALCAEDGLQGAATARIAKAAGVANGTLFPPLSEQGGADPPALSGCENPDGGRHP